VQQSTGRRLYKLTSKDRIGKGAAARFQPRQLQQRAGVNGWINAGDNGSLGYTNGDQRVVHGLLKGSGRRIHKEHSGIMEINDVKAALAAHPAGTFLNLMAFNGHNLGACDITGVSPVWKTQPDTDERCRSTSCKAGLR